MSIEDLGRAEAEALSNCGTGIEIIKDSKGTIVSQPRTCVVIEVKKESEMKNIQIKGIDYDCLGCETKLSGIQTCGICCCSRSNVRMNGSKPSRLLVARTFEPTSTRSQRTPALSTDQTDMSNPLTTLGMLEVRPPAPFAAGTAAAAAAGTTMYNDAPGQHRRGRRPRGR